MQPLWGLPYGTTHHTPMSVNLLDLLPEDRRRKIRRAYILRVGTVAAVLGIVLVAAAAALLVPTHIYLVSALKAQSVRLVSVESTISAADQTALGKRLATLSADATEIAQLGTTPSASALIREVLAIGRPGIVLTGISYTPSQSTLALSGVAATRNDLRAYQLSLAATPRFVNAALPVSSYAKDRDILFAITITLATSTSP